MFFSTPFSRPASTPVWPEARPLHLGDGDIGVVMCHGFTGSVASIRPWAEALATPAEEYSGVRVVAPRLPGHGTSWQDMARMRWWSIRCPRSCVAALPTLASRRCGGWWRKPGRVG